MMVDTRLINERREEMLREVEANRTAKALRESRRVESHLDEPRLSAFARELGLDIVRLVGVFRSSGKVAKRRGRL